MPTVLLLACGGPALASAGDPGAVETIEATGAVLVEAVNQPDSTARRAYLPRIFDRAKLLEIGESRALALLASLSRQFAPLEYHHSEVSRSGTGESTRMVLHVYARSGDGWKDFQLRLSPAPPHRVTEIAFVASVAEPVYLPNGDITSRETLDWLDRWITKLAGDEDLAGSILIARGGDVLYERTFGFADSARARPVSATTAFGMGSGSKMYTAIVIAQLVAEGKVAWEESIAKYFPDFPDSGFARRCQIIHLLSHTSGLNEYWTDRFVREGASIRTLADFLPFVYSEGTSFPPGSRYAYSNSNYILAGLIAERVTRESYFDLVRKRIFQPVAMKETYWDDEPGGKHEEAERLTGAPKKWRHVTFIPRSSSAGGARTTARDQLTFSRALRGGRLVPPEMLAKMTAARDSAGEYGLGFELAKRGGTRSYGHGGIAPGVNFELRMFPDRDITLVVMSNQDNGAYDDLRRLTTKLITGER
jgi:CubicO group peptidase (beta-lactamase class C family)